MRLILFDIDGTLLACGRQLRRIFASVLEGVFGTAGDPEGFNFSGKTDPQIVVELLVPAGVPPETIRDLLPEFRRRYFETLERQLKREDMRLLPGVIDLLERLGRRNEACVGLLTGNWETGARIKLSRFRLNPYFPFGAFGEDGTRRDDLLPVALRRAGACRGRRFEPRDTLIVGDSLLDVSCARNHGAAALAVATGTTSAEDLLAAGADWVVSDLARAQSCVPIFAA